MFSPEARARVALGLLLLVGLAVRLLNLDSAGVATDRQYRSLLIARAIYYEISDLPCDHVCRAARMSSQRQEALEPPVTEALVAALYRLAGGEDHRVPKITCSLLWLLGAIPLFALTRLLGSLAAAIAATAYYLLLPAAVLTSLSFLPESLMIAAMLTGLLIIAHYWQQPSTSRLIGAGLASGIAIFLKPLTTFCILAVFVALALHHPSSRALAVRRTIVFATLSLGPSLLYYGRGILVEDYLQWKVAVSFLPHLFLSSEFWKGWLVTATGFAGLWAVVLALLGMPLLPASPQSVLQRGLWAGYLLFCFFFNYFIYFVPYYHVQLIVAVAITLGPVLALIVSQLPWTRLRGKSGSFVVVALGLLAAMLWREIGRQQASPRFENPEVAQEIGEIVNHSHKVAYLAYVYGLPLEYHGHLAGEYWPRPRAPWPLASKVEADRSIEERISQIGFTPEFFVITNFREYDSHHPDLQGFLRQRCLLVARTSDYLIYAVPDSALASRQGA